MFSLGESFDGVRDELCMSLRRDVIGNGRASDFELHTEILEHLCGFFLRQLFNAVDDFVTL